MYVLEEQEVEYFTDKNGEEYGLTKKDINYWFAETYLEILTHLLKLRDDEKFMFLHKQLKEYLLSKLEIPDDDELVEEYCVLVHRQSKPRK